MKRTIGRGMVAFVTLVAVAFIVALLVQRCTAEPPMAPVPSGVTAPAPTPTGDVPVTPTTAPQVPAPTTHDDNVITTTSADVDQSTGPPVANEDEPTELIDPSGLPQYLALHCADDLLVSVDQLAASTTPDGGVWSPVPGTIEWWASTGSPLPGQVSPYAAVLAGHVRYDGTPDVFWNLADARSGCIITVQYSSGDIAQFEVVDAPEPVDKDRFMRESRYDHYWEPTEPGIWLTLVTCDVQSGLRSDGHLQGNIALRAVRIS